MIMGMGNKSLIRVVLNEFAYLTGISITSVISWNSLLRHVT
jgi:hypothetical protein